MLLAIAPADTRASWTSSANSSSPRAPGWGWLTEIDPKCLRPSSSGTRSDDTPRAARSWWLLDTKEISASVAPLSRLACSAMRSTITSSSSDPDTSSAACLSICSSRARRVSAAATVERSKHGCGEVGQHEGDVEVATGERLLGVQAGGQDHALLAAVPPRDGHAHHRRRAELVPDAVGDVLPEGGSRAVQQHRRRLPVLHAGQEEGPVALEDDLRWPRPQPVVGAPVGRLEHRAELGVAKPAAQRLDLRAGVVDPEQGDPVDRHQPPRVGDQRLERSFGRGRCGTGRGGNCNGHRGSGPQ